MIRPADTLGSAILLARDMARGWDGEDTPTPATVVQYADDLRLAVIPSEEYAKLRERSMHGGLVPLLSFLPHGGLDVHRASFEGIGDALRNHTRGT